jgi:hypothetical protein
MSTYFSSIVRQMGHGLHRPTRGSAQPETPPAQKSRDHDPLEREEIVLMPSRQTGAHNTAARGLDTPDLVSRSSALRTPKTERQAKQSKTAKPKGSTAIDRTKDMALRETLVLVDSTNTDAGPKAGSKAGRKVRDADADKKDNKVFFEKTSEIIKGRQADPDEVRNIVLHEVQEWVAAVPDETAAEPETMSSDDIRFLTGVSPTSRDATGEEYFELSIGSISVIIEGDEKPKLQNDLQPRREQGRIDTERSASSLLDRRYL